jgi:hypothetical protein
MTKTKAPSPSLSPYPSSPPPAVVTKPKARGKRSTKTTTKAPKSAASPPDVQEDEGPEVVGFLSLPPEIRNIIYRQVLCHDDKIYFHDYKRGYHVPGRAYTGNLGSKPLGGNVLLPRLLTTHSTIYHEGASILYGENEFVVAMSEAASQDIHFFNRIGESIRFIRNLTLFRGSPIKPVVRDEVFTKLGRMAMLQSLVWHHDLKSKPLAAAKLLLPCMQAVQKRIDESGQDGEDDMEVDILTIKEHVGAETPGPRPKSWRAWASFGNESPEPEPPEEDNSAAQTYESSVKDHLRRLLEPEYE